MLPLHAMFCWAIYQSVTCAGVVNQSIYPNGPLVYNEGDTATVTWSYSYSPSLGGSTLSDNVTGGSGQIIWGGVPHTSFAVDPDNSGSKTVSQTLFDDGFVSVSATGMITATQSGGYYVYYWWGSRWIPVTSTSSHAISGNLTLQVLNVAPTIEFISGDLSVDAGETFLFSASASDPGIYDALSYEWDLDQDGEFDDFLGSDGGWSYLTAGEYLVRLRVTDGDGGNAYREFNVSVNAIASSAQAAPEAASLAIWALLGLTFSARIWWQRHRGAVN